MNGPEHYRRAEALLRSAQLPGEDDVNDEGVPVATYPATELDEDTGQQVNSVVNAILAAQVHATLALAAAQGVDTHSVSTPVERPAPLLVEPPEYDYLEEERP